jgi:hypothetical protein
VKATVRTHAEPVFIQVSKIQGPRFAGRSKGITTAMEAQGSLIDLQRSRDLGEILGGAFRLYRSRFSLFAIIAFAVVVPVDVLIYGVAGEWLWTDPDWGDSLPVGAAVATWLAPWLVTTPLITAGHVHAVMDLGAGREPSPGRALAAAARRLTPVAAAVSLSALGSSLGLIFLVVPGVYLWTRWFLSAQAVVAEDLGPLEGMERSADIVRGQWWRIFGTALVITLIAGILAALLGVSLQATGFEVGIGPLALLGQIVADAISLSFAALAGTLLYFDARARKQRQFTPPQPDLTLPERPA